MKRILQNCTAIKNLILICGLLFIGGSAWADTPTTYYAALKAKLSSSSNGMGTVYAGTSNTAGTYGAESTSTKQTSTTENEEKQFYAFAKANEGYSFTGWSNSDGGSIVSTDNPYKVSVSCSSSTESNPTTKTVFANFIQNVALGITFMPGTNGSYTVNGTKITTAGGQTITCEGATSLVATAASGYKFFGWYTSTDGGTTKNYFSYAANVSFTFTSAVTVYADFVPSSTAVFVRDRNEAVHYKGLAEALSGFSSGLICLYENGTVPAGNYSIPSGVTLLIPYDAAYTLYTTKPGISKAAPSGQTVFRKLTLAPNASIVVNGSGAISVGAMQSKNQPYGGCVTGAYGQIDMQEGSSIILNSGTKLYCWGYITGDGVIEAKSGSSVYEDFQITCWRGGSAASSMVSAEKVFALAQYYIQNVEAKLKFYAGASETVYTGVTVSFVDPECSVKIIGSSDDVMFKISTGTLTKWYDAATDRQMYQIDGNSSIGYVYIDMYATIDSRNYVLPLTNNMDITVNSGTFTCDKKVGLLPGAKITINEGANVSLGSNSELYVYDKDNWGQYNYATSTTKPTANDGKICCLPYCAATGTNITKKRSWASTTDATMDINGTITTASGHFYVANGAAEIYSSKGTGKVVFTKAAGSKANTQQATQSGTSMTYVDIPTTPVKLHNSTTVASVYGADLEYLATAGTAANTTITYKNGHWGWMEIWKDEDGTVLKALNTCTQQSGAAPGNPTKECYTFTEWSTETSTANQEVIHTATYSDTPTTYAITYSAGANGSGTVAGGTKTCGVDFTLSSSTFTRIGYYQTGWSTEDGGAKAYELGGSYTTNAAQTFYPSWAPYVATVSVGGEDPTYYATIAEAIDAANGMSNATVTMLQNATVASEITLSAAMTIDLNGKTVSSTLASATGVFNINASGKTITIKDSDTGGKIDHTASYSGKLYGINFTAGSLNIIGGTIYAKNTTTANNTDYRAYGIFTSSASAITMSGGMIEAHTPSNPSAFGIYAGNACTFTMTDGTIRATGTSSVRGVYLQGTTTLSDKATITATATGENSYTIFAKAGTMTINNGTYAAEGTGSAYVIFFEAGTVTVNGGKFNGSTCELTKRNTAYNVILKGGVYVHETDLAAKCAANHHVFDLTSGADYDEGYRYKVAEAYTVTFNANGHGTAPESQLIVKGQNATEPSPAPTVEGYDFGGWYKEAGCTNVWNFASDVVTAATPLYAKWTLKKYTITYNKGANGTGSIAAGEKTHDAAFTLSNSTFTREGYTQTGWSTTDGGAKAYDFGESYTDNAAITLYPFWTINKYTITFQNGEEVLQSGKVEYGQTPNYSGETPTKAADAHYTFTFSGWSPAIASVTGEATYTAQFSSTVNNYTLTIATNEVNYGYVDKGSVTVPYGSTVTVSGNTFTVNDITVTATPTANDADYTYAFKQWNNLPETVTGNVANIQAEFVRTPLNLDVTTHESVEATETINTTIVHENGQLEIATDKTLTTGDLIIEATPETSGEVRGTVVATNAYFDLTRGVGKVFKHHTWYAFSVPFQADAAEILFDGEKLQYNMVSKKDAYDILYYDGADRATHGSASSNWKYVENDEGAKKYLHPGVLYMIAITKRDVTKIRFTRDGGELLTTSVDVAPHAPSTGNDKDANWNGVANPALFHANMSGLGSPEDIVWIYDPDAEDPTNPYVTTVLTNKKKVVLGQAFFVQTPREEPLVVKPASPESSVLAAPARSRGNRSTEEDSNRYMVKIAKADGPEADFVIVRADEEKEENTYVLGKDLVRMGVSSIRPQLWVNRYDAKLIVNAMAPVNGQTEYPLGISAPEYGEYAIYTEAPQNDETVLYLTRDGRVIWNLNYGTYTTTLDKGTTDRYGLRIVSKAPQTATGIGEAVVDAHGETQKVLMDNQVFIIRNGEVYTTTGQKIK